MLANLCMIPVSAMSSLGVNAFASKNDTNEYKYKTNRYMSSLLQQKCKYEIAVQQLLFQCTFNFYYVIIN
jgi:hypothetical protein